MPLVEPIEMYSHLRLSAKLEEHIRTNGAFVRYFHLIDVGLAVTQDKAVSLSVNFKDRLNTLLEGYSEDLIFGD